MSNHERPYPTLAALDRKVRVDALLDHHLNGPGSGGGSTLAPAGAGPGGSGQRVPA